MLIKSILLELLAAALFLIPIYLILNAMIFHNLRKSLLFFIFSLYLAAVYALVGMPNVTYIRFELNLNPIPLIGIIDDLKNSLLNVLLFVPLGAGLPLLWKKYQSALNSVLVGFGFSLAIELLQIFTYRATDVNDLITNTLGTFVGFILGRWALKTLPVIQDPVNAEKGNELWIVCALTFLVMFFAQPFALSVIWDLFMS